MCTVSTTDVLKLLTVRGANFEKVKPGDSENGAEVVNIDTVDDIVASQQG